MTDLYRIVTSMQCCQQILLDHRIKSRPTYESNYDTAQ